MCLNLVPVPRASLSILERLGQQTLSTNGAASFIEKFIIIRVHRLQIGEVFQIFTIDTNSFITSIAISKNEMTK